MEQGADGTIAELIGVRWSYRVGAAGRSFFSAASKAVLALAGVDLRIVRGEVFGLIGPNGAGKSTTVKLLTGLLRPDAGKVRLLGKNPFKNRQRLAQRYGVLFGQKSQLWWDLPLIESFELLRRIYGVPADEYAQRLEQLTAALGLEPLLGRPVRLLSLGQRMRGELAATLLHGPEVVFLDEPTIGLDVVAKEELQRFLLTENRERGTTVLLTSHDLGDVERLATRVGLLDRGRLVYQGEVRGLVELAGFDKVVRVFCETCPAAPPPLVPLVRSQYWVDYALDSRQLTPEEAIRLASGPGVRAVEVREPGLAELIARIYGKERS